jgi:ubiquinone/menaquinone biosynthesis C-methylase UbiE
MFLLFSGIACAQYRDVWQQPVAIMDSLGISRGMAIGEAGAGDGYFTFHLAGRVGPEGMVYANDIDDDALDDLRARMKRDDVQNIVPILSEPDDPMFPERKLDMVVMMNVFHHIENPTEWMKNVISSMKPGALMVFIETDPDKRSSGRDHFLTKKEILDRMEETRFEFVRRLDFLERDTIHIFALDSAR